MNFESRVERTSAEPFEDSEEAATKRRRRLMIGGAVAAVLVLALTSVAVGLVVLLPKIRLAAGW